MITSELIQMVKDHTQYDLDNSAGTAPTDAQIVAQINWAQRAIARIVEPFDPSITLTLTGSTATYNLRSLTVVSKKVIRIARVMINGVWLMTRSGRDPGLWSLDEIEQYAPTWRTDGTGTPTKAVQYDTTLLLHQSPSGVFANNYIAGVYFPADLSSSSLSGVPDLEEELHEALAMTAAIYAADPMVSEAEGLSRLARFNGRAAEAIRQVQLDKQNARSSFEGTLDSYYGRFLPV